MASWDTTKDVAKRLGTAEIWGATRNKAIMDRVYRGLAPPSHAIKAKCISCVGGEEVVVRVGECSCYSCPLHAYRPFRNGDEPDELAGE